MTFEPRYFVLVPYGLGWMLVLGFFLGDLPGVFLTTAVVVQLLNTLSVVWIPVRVSIRERTVGAYFPLCTATRHFQVDAIEVTIRRNPLRLFRFSDLLVLRSSHSKCVIWRLGVSDFNWVCAALTERNGIL